MTPSEFLAQRIPQPQSMSTAQWDMVKADVRERAFFMAGVANAEALNLFKTQTARMVKGEISQAEFRVQIRDGLKKMGYQPPAGKEGTIHDLRSYQRQNVVAETNVGLAQGYAAYHRQFALRSVWPAKQMVRQTPKKVPRDWPARWKAAAASSGAPKDSYNVAEMAALIDSPIWTTLSRFGVPYPIYDWNSGMGDRMLDRETAEAMGLKPGAPVTPEDDRSPASFNEQLQAPLDIKDKEVLQGLKEEMEGLADVKPGEIVWRDPNGTKPVAPEELAAVIATPNTAGIELQQKAVMQSYQTGGPAAIQQGTADAEYFRRLITRVETSQPGPLRHEQSFTTDGERSVFLSRLQNRTTGGWDGGPFPYPTASRATERAMQSAKEGFPVTLTIRDYKTAKDTGPAVESITGKPPVRDPIFWIPFTVFVIEEILRHDSGEVEVIVAEDEP